jgi:hypothetical protein
MMGERQTRAPPGLRHLRLCKDRPLSLGSTCVILAINTEQHGCASGTVSQGDYLHSCFLRDRRGRRCISPMPVYNVGFTDTSRSGTFIALHLWALKSEP